MPKYTCCVHKCKSDQRKLSNLSKYPWMSDVSFHSFPHARHQKSERRKWLQHIKREHFIPNNESRVCSLHFVGGKGPTTQNPLPTLFPYNNWKMPATPRSTRSITKRDVDSTKVEQPSASSTTELVYERIPESDLYPYVAGECTIAQTSPDILSCSISRPVVPPSTDHEYCKTAEVSKSASCTAAVQTNLTMDELEKMIDDSAELESLQEKFNNKEELLKTILKNLITKDDSKVKKYTGLPSVNVLLGLFEVLKSGAEKLKYWSGSGSVSEKKYQRDPACKKPGPSRKLSIYEEYLLTLLRLRVGLTNAFLGDLFGVAESTVSSIFVTWITYMYKVLKPLLIFPSRQNIDLHMPSSFQAEYPRTRVIIDCTEIFIEKPRTSPSAQAATYSQYKSHNTYKVLIGITPNGAFSFLSDLWGGNVSDRHITLNSGLLNVLEPGDDVMADRGFTIRDALTLIKCTLNMPPFTRKCSWGKKKRLNAAEIQQTARIAKLRIHVERAIGRLRHFRLLDNVMPLTLKPIAQQIITVAAILCNFLPALVSK